MNYKISFLEMDLLAVQANSNKSSISLQKIQRQAKELKDKSITKVKKISKRPLANFFDYIYCTVSAQ